MFHRPRPKPSGYHKVASDILICAQWRWEAEDATTKTFRAKISEYASPCIHVVIITGTAPTTNQPYSPCTLSNDNLVDVAQSFTINRASLCGKRKMRMQQQTHLQRNSVCTRHHSFGRHHGGGSNDKSPILTMYHLTVTTFWM